MYVEFTKKLKQYNWGEIINALNENERNFSPISQNRDHILLIEKLLKKPKSSVSFSDFCLLLELAAENRKLWEPCETLKVFFFKSQSDIRDKVLTFASTWSNFCSIKFVETKKIFEAKIRISFQPPGSWSYIGTDALSVPISQSTVNFGWLNTQTKHKDFKQVVLHEFGHVLGLVHEHQNPNKKINWNKSYVYWFFAKNYKWSPSDVDVNIFQEYEKDSLNYSEFDPLSIMGYQIPPEFTTDKLSLPINYDLSETDKKHIGDLYPNSVFS